MVELEVESSVGEGEFVVDMPERDEQDLEARSTPSIPRNTKSFKGIKGRFFINSPSVKPGDRVVVMFNGKYNNKSITISKIQATVEMVNNKEFKLLCLLNYSFNLKGKKLFLRRRQIITVVKEYNGKKLKYTF